MSREYDIQREMELHHRRLQVLKEQRAIQGISVDPKIIIEIESIKAEIEKLQTELKVLEEVSSSIVSQVTSSDESVTDTDSKQRIQIYLQGEFSLLSDERRSAAIAAFAAVIGVSPQKIEVYRVYAGSIIFDLGIPSNAVQYLRSLLKSNSEKLRLLKIEKVILKSELNVIEEWLLQEGKFTLITSMTDILGQVLKDSIQNELDRLVAEESWVYGFSPRQIRQRHPELFTGPTQVSQIKRNILKRVRRRLLEVRRLFEERNALSDAVAGTIPEDPKIIIDSYKLLLSLK